MDTSKSQMEPVEAPPPPAQGQHLLARMLQALTQPSRELIPDSGKKHQRAGITTNKGRGESKSRRRMAKQSRLLNRRYR